jgi:pimeloyl-ACP methyl ester carboxylesterase
MTGSEIVPFYVDIPQAHLDDLATRLDMARWPAQPDGTGWDYGIPLAYLKDLAHHWRHGYDWRVHEAQLNKFPQYTTEIDGQPIHFLHVRSENADALPLLLTHGWPSSVVEFLGMVEPLARDFHLVVPSLPGFGFSGPTRQTGWTVQRIAAAWAELMRRLGYTRYGVHGGDWGAVVSRELGRVRPDEVAGVHLTFLLTMPSGDPAELAALTEADRARLGRLRQFSVAGSGYRFIQATRPHTVAYGLNDSPIGLLAWIAEKFEEWTELPVDRDLLLTNVMLYWLTGTAESSARIYKDAAASLGPVPPSRTPTGIALFPQEIGAPIRDLAERTDAIVHWSEFPQGGHFPALECPAVLADDIRAFFGRP